MSKTEILEMLQEFLSSGKSQLAWCKEHGINRGVLRYWLKRIEELVDGDEIKFAEVVIGGDVDC